MRRATGARVEAEGLTLRTGEGVVFAGVELDARPGTLTALHADSGGGRTALLLTLAGRMRPSSGTLYVDGHALPKRARRVRRIAALGLSNGVNDLEDRLRVREHLTERLHLRLHAARRPMRAEALAAAGLADLDTKALVRTLSTLQRRRLGVALALLDEPRLLLVDDVDLGLSPAHQMDLWDTLAELADSGLTVIATCADAAGAPDPVTVVPLGQGPPDATADTEEPEDTGDAEDTGAHGITRRPVALRPAGRHQRMDPDTPADTPADTAADTTGGDRADDRTLPLDELFGPGPADTPADPGPRRDPEDTP